MGVLCHVACALVPGTWHVCLGGGHGGGHAAVEQGAMRLPGCRWRGWVGWDGHAAVKAWKSLGGHLGIIAIAASDGCGKVREGPEG